MISSCLRAAVLVDVKPVEDSRREDLAAAVARRDTGKSLLYS
jgi:hypothetical protein